MLASFFAVVAVGVCGISYASYLPELTISRIDVHGADAVDPVLIRSVADEELERNSLPFISGRNVFLFRSRAIETALGEYFPRIESAEISRESLLATAIAIAVKERNAFALWCDEVGVCYAMDSSGFVFATASSTASFRSPYIFSGAIAASTSPIGRSYIPGRFSGILAFLERLGQAGLEVESVSMESGQDFAVKLSRGFDVRATFGANVGEIAKNLELVLSSEALRGKDDLLEHIDLRFGNRVYYKFKGDEEKRAE